LLKRSACRSFLKDRCPQPHIRYRLHPARFRCCCCCYYPLGCCCSLLCACCVRNTVIDNHEIHCYPIAGLRVNVRSGAKEERDTQAQGFGRCEVQDLYNSIGVSNALLRTLFVVAGAGAAGVSRTSFIYIILQVSIKDGSFDGLEGLDPTVSWSDSTKSGDLDLTYGIEASIRPTSDIASLPKAIWGKASTRISDWDVTARGELDGQDFSRADVTLDASNLNSDLSLHLDATANGEFLINNVEATKGIDQDGARITVTPRYNVQTEEKDVVITYAKDKTSAKITASPDAQEITLSQQIDFQNRIAPTFNNVGDISVEWERTLKAGGSVTTSLTPNKEIDVVWKDGEWTANVNMPISGTDILGATVSIKRDVEF